MMNHVLFATMLTAGLVAMGGAMVCNYCGLSLEEDCLGNSTQTMTCRANQSCYIQTLNLTSSVYRTKGCVDNSQCDRMELLTGFNATVRLSTECCTTDQCNGATSLDVGLPAVIIAALVAVWSS
ncbi:sperm acrosome membrane-associated protein 4 [Gadus morhua]|uniref:sperm acrosome membrane-associated protein 4 n=1 Tax=Gadus morhua TaxID=8049 RepID=UPI0011B62D59|nr:sperm acrosome membrane-associated protein 4-like [Gadus morhua]